MLLVIHEWTRQGSEFQWCNVSQLLSHVTAYD